MGNKNLCCNTENERDGTMFSVKSGGKRKYNTRDIESLLGVMPKTFSEQDEEKKQQVEETVSKLENATSSENIYDLYKMGRVVGNGHYGTVRLASPAKKPEKVVAVKTI